MMAPLAAFLALLLSFAAHVMPSDQRPAATVPANSSTEPITVTAPHPLATISASTTPRLRIAGSAFAHEGMLAWSLEPAGDTTAVLDGTFQASCGAPCRGTFATDVSLAHVPQGEYELHVWVPNQEDDASPRLFDTPVPITITRD